ncbi:hypothetical protein AeRB84_011623 [Aphanomyces euteiches]|nr:hypothetical protein AeRB84_011623 [Aphanomyces euteiches]
MSNAFHRPSPVALEAQGRQALKTRLRQRCFELRLDLDRVFHDSKQGESLIAPAQFYKTLAAHGIALDDDEKKLLAHLTTPSGLVSLDAFLDFVDIHAPDDHVDPELAFAALPQPFRMLDKLLHDDILDRAWGIISSSIKFKLEQGQLSAEDRSEDAAKSRLCRPIVTIPLKTAPSAALQWPIAITSDREMLALVHEATLLELLDSTAAQTTLQKTPVFPAGYQIPCLSRFQTMQRGPVKATFFVVGGWKLPPTAIENQGETPPPPPVSDVFESLIHVYSTDGTSLALRCTLSSKDRVIALTLAEDAAFLAVQFENGVVSVFDTTCLVAEMDATPPPATFVLDATKLCLSVDAATVFRIWSPPKPVAVDVPPPTKADKPKAGKAKEPVEEAAAAAPPQPLVYPFYLFLAFLTAKTSPEQSVTTTGIILASQHKMLQFHLTTASSGRPNDAVKDKEPSPVPPSPSPHSTLLLPAVLTSAALDLTASLVILGLKNGTIFAWNSRLGVEHGGLGCHSAPVVSMALFKDEFLLSLSADNEVHFYDLRARADMQSSTLSTGSGKRSLMRVRRGANSAFVSVHTLYDMPLAFVGQEDGSILVFDCRTADVIGTIDGRNEFRGSEVALPFGSCWTILGDELYLPKTSTADSAILLQHFTAASIVQTCLPASGLNWRTSFLERTSTPQAPQSSGSSKPSPPSTSNHLARLRRPSSSASSLASLAASLSPSLSTASGSSLASFKGETVAAPPRIMCCNVHLSTPPELKTLRSIYNHVLSKHNAMASERDARMAKRRSDVLKTLNAIWQ